jgi:hypothetical protein
MAEKKKSGRFWNFILVIGLIFFIVGFVSGIRELLNLRTTSIKLSEYMVDAPKGSKLELLDCSINHSFCRDVKRRSRRSNRKYTRAEFCLLEPAEKVQNPKTFVFADIEAVSASDKEKAVSTDSLGNRSVKGWIMFEPDPGVKKDIRKMLNAPGAEIAYLKLGIKPVSETVYYPLAVGLACFLILIIRANIINLIEKRRKVKEQITEGKIT